MIILAHQLIPILLPIIKQQIEDIINQRIPGPLKIPVDNVMHYLIMLQTCFIIIILQLLPVVLKF